MKKGAYNKSFMNASVFVVIACTYLLLINSFSDYSHIKPMQQFMAWTVYSLQHLFGINVILQGTSLVYPNVFKLNVTLLCTGINELLMFSMITLGFIGVSLKTKLKGYTVFFPIIIAENVIRISLIFPLASWLGTDKALTFHDFSFKYGQMFFVILLVFLWFKYFAREEFIHGVQSYRLSRRLKLRKLRQKRKR